MSGPGNNDYSIPNAESGYACLDLENYQIHVKNELKTSDYSIGLADDSAANISLIITKQVPDVAGTEWLQESMSKSDVADSIGNKSTEVECVKDEDVKTIESSHKGSLSDDTISPVSTGPSINRKLLIKNGTNFSITKTMLITEEESFKNHSSSIADRPFEEAFSADKPKTKAEDTPENIGGTKGFKESVSGSGYVNEFIENEECMVLESGKSSKDTTVNVKQDKASSENIINPDTYPHTILKNDKAIKESIGTSDSVKKLMENEEMVRESGKFSQDQGSPQKNVNPETVYNQNMKITNAINESVISSESVNELPENEEMLLESGELSQDQDSPPKIVNPETIYNPSMGITKDLNESVISSESFNEWPENEEMVLESGELSQDTTIDIEQVPRKASEESEDVEDGEVSDENDCIPVKVPVCRFYIRNGCNWGNNCRFRHPGTNKRGNYVMFENKVLPVVSTPLPSVWTPMQPAFPFILNNVNADRYYSQDPPEAPKRAPLLPTPSFNDILLAQKNYTKVDDLKRPVRNEPQPVVWSSRQSISSPCSTAIPWSPGRNRSPSDSPPKRFHHVSLQVRPTDTAIPSLKPSIKRYRLPSPSQSSAPRIRGPRTPPSSPPIRPSATVQTAPKRKRRYTYLSSSTDSSDSSSYTSTTESSEEDSSSSDSDSDNEYWRMSSRQRNRKQPSKKQAKSLPRALTKCSSRQLYSPRRQDTSVTKETSRHASKSKSLKYSKNQKMSPKGTPEKALPMVPTKQSGKLLGDGNSSYSGRREYLLMKLIQVEKLIAKKKKKMNMK